MRKKLISAKEKKRRNERSVKLTAGILFLCFFCGCGIEKTDRNKVCDLEYCIVENEDIPEELKTKIEEKKASEFHLVFDTGDYLYLVKGYGEQETGGYSIQMKELYLTKNAIIFTAKLLGPAKDEIKTASPSYPYIVIRTKYMDKNVVFS